MVRLVKKRLDSTRLGVPGWGLCWLSRPAGSHGERCGGESVSHLKRGVCSVVCEVSEYRVR
jgi:hypothetical protein